MRILVVEDDENSRVYLNTILEASGYEVASAGNGKAALAVMDLQPPDLIISDIMMPEMDGFALCRAIKSNPATAPIPFIFYTATFTTDTDQQLAEEVGADRFLLKPMELDKFLEEVRSALANRGSPAAAKPPPAPNAEGGINGKYAQVVARKLEKKNYELKTARKQLEASTELLRRIQESNEVAQKLARVGCWDWAVSQNSLWWSTETQNILGIDSPLQLPDLPLLISRIAPNDRERFERALALAAEKGVPFKMDHQVLGYEDAIRLVHSEAEIMEFDAQSGTPLRIVCAMRDITEQRQMEEDKARLEATLRQNQKMEALGALASGIAHDFNNVLTAILGNAELLRMQLSPLSPDNQECLEQIVSGSRRATELVRQILTFSRQGEQAKHPTDLCPIIKEALKFMRAAVPTTIDIDCRLESPCPAVLADPTQIYQVVMNLCVNAIHAMQARPGKLEVTLRAEQVDAWHELARSGLRAGAYLRLTVSDTGCGMDAATRDRIFDPFFTTKPKGKGTGLGLTVVHGIILAHNGHIVVTSEVDQGTTFSIYLPALKQAAEVQPTAAASMVRGHGEHILLVDDEVATTKVIANMLQELNYQVTEVNTSSGALALFQQTPGQYQLLVTDLTMPVMDGLMLARTIAKQQPGFPIILCTGFSEVVDRPLAAGSGVSMVLTKPFMLRELAAAIQQVLRKKT